ncbi:hypothetical protein N9594_01190 [bacterium]|nr:hypothetical protein [bacterium]
MGGEGKIGQNIGRFLERQGIDFTSVARKSASSSISFSSFIQIVKSNDSRLVINAGRLSCKNVFEFRDNAHKSTKIIHISSVAVYGNSVYSNIVAPINQYGKWKALEEKLFVSRFSVYVIRLANIYGGEPETSGALGLYKEGKLEFFEVDEKGRGLVRDYIDIESFLSRLYVGLKNHERKIVNSSSGIGQTLSEFLSLRGIDISNLEEVKYDKGTSIRESIIDNNYEKKL